jgi:hypothetical protein
MSYPPDITKSDEQPSEIASIKPETGAGENLTLYKKLLPALETHAKSSFGKYGAESNTQVGYESNSICLRIVSRPT